jgi:hypothetical protein
MRRFPTIATGRRQDLNEVHMLIDFVSGRADRSLTTLSFRDPQDPPG